MTPTHNPNLSIARLVLAGVVYYALTMVLELALGFTCLPIVLLVVGNTGQELLLRSLTVLSAFFAAGWVIRKFQIPPDMRGRLTVGLIASLLSVIAAACIRSLNQAPSSQLLPKDPLRAVLLLTTLVLVALLPWLLGRRSASTKRHEASESKEARKPNALSALKTAALAAIFSVVATFPIAALTALLHEFPLPQQGTDIQFESGMQAVLPSQLVVLYVGFFGGFPALATISSVFAASIAVLTRPPETSHALLIAATTGLFVAGVGVYLIVNFDTVF